MNEPSEFQYSMCNLCKCIYVYYNMYYNGILYIVYNFTVWHSMQRRRDIVKILFIQHQFFSVYLCVACVYCVYVAVRKICNFNLSRLLSFLLTSNNRCQLHQNEERYCSDGTSLSSAFPFILYSSIITMSIYYLILFLSTNFRLYTILFKFVFIQLLHSICSILFSKLLALHA